VRAGDHVDLLVTIKPAERQVDQTQPMGTPVAAAATPTPAADIQVGTTQTTMQNLKVLAIGAVLPAAVAEGDKAKGAAQPGPSPQSLITFAVERQDALTLKALKDTERVKLEMVLRGAGDEEVAKTDAVTLNTIIDRYQFRAVATPRAQPGAGR
jgi:Flp pilus assembly protein CpaB